MQSYCDVPGEVGKRFPMAQRNGQSEGKENCSPVFPQPNKKTLLTTASTGLQKSRLPIPTKTREPPNFHKLHQTWQSHFQKGKAVCKRSCTRPQPFNFSHKERSRAHTVTDAGGSGEPPDEQPLRHSPASLKPREPLAKIVLGQKNEESNEQKGGAEVEFRADPAALASILSNKGVPAAPIGKVSLAQRVPMRASSVAHPHRANTNVMVRSSMYSMPSNRTVPANLDRMSCFSKMTVKATDQKPLFRYQKMPVSDATAKETSNSKKEDALNQQENPLLQQMNPPSCVPASKEICVEKPTSLPDNGASAEIPVALCGKSPVETDGSVTKLFAPKPENPGSEDFVEDSQALASILSNTETGITNCGKLSLAQRIPMQGRSSLFKGPMVLSGTSVKLSPTPKPTHGPTSNVTVPLKDITFSPCRVPNALISSDNNSGGSARRVLQPKSSAVKFSQPYSLTSKQPVFPKTPRALAVEKANKRHVAESAEIQTSSKSVVKWRDELSPFPASEVLCENEPDMEQIAVRLFLDGECPSESGKKKQPTTAPQQEPSSSEKCSNDAPGPDAGISSGFRLHNNMPPAPSLQNASNPSCSIASSVPLSFLSHPAVKALQSCPSGSFSLPDITRLRLQAALSAKQRFWEACLDEECAFYTSRRVAGSCRRCSDPVSNYLERQEYMHFTPIVVESSTEGSPAQKTSSPLYGPESDHLETNSSKEQLD